MNINYSDEQTAIINAVASNNVLIQACAGSGKSHTCIGMAQRYPHLKILIITYNSKLRLDVATKIARMGLENIHAHTYHSFMYNNYRPCTNDAELRKILSESLAPKITSKYDIIVFDEAQDMTKLYHDTACKIYNDFSTIENVNNVATHTARIVIAGDQYQCIYQYKGARANYIVEAPKYFALNAHPWRSLTLSTSYRLTPPMGDFVNNCLLKRHFINTVAAPNIVYAPVRYLICDVFGQTPRLAREIYAKITEGIITPADVFILAPSVKSERSPCRKLAEELSKLGLQIYMPINDECKLDEDIMRGKIVFSSFHQSKGMERKYVMSYGFDEYYRNMCDELDRCPDQCPNTLYVAATRASQYLTVVHSHRNNYLPFIDSDTLKTSPSVNFDEITKLNIVENPRKNNTSLAVTQLVKHLSEDTLVAAMQHIDCVDVVSADDITEAPINIPTKTQQRQGYEDVSDINGSAIPLWYELKRLGRHGTMERILGELKHARECVPIYTSLFSGVERYTVDTLTLPQFLHTVNMWKAYTDDTNYRVRQINDYTWMSEDLLERAIDRLSRELSPQVVMEQYVGKQVGDNDHGRLVHGYIDGVDRDHTRHNIYEFKFTLKLSDEHKLQLATYMYLTLTREQDLVNQRRDILEAEMALYRFNLVQARRDPNPGDEIEASVLDENQQAKNVILTVKKVFKNGNIDTMEKIKIGGRDVIRNCTYERDHPGRIQRMNEINAQLVDIVSGINNVRYYLYNIRDGVKVEIKSTRERLATMMTVLMTSKIRK